jgi:hypothetical protein
MLLFLTILLTILLTIFMTLFIIIFLAICLVDEIPQAIRRMASVVITDCESVILAFTAMKEKFSLISGVSVVGAELLLS